MILSLMIANNAAAAIVFPIAATVAVKVRSEWLAAAAKPLQRSMQAAGCSSPGAASARQARWASAARFSCLTTPLVLLRDPSLPPPAGQH